MKNNIPTVLQSSVDSTKVSLTLKGLAVLGILAILNYYGIVVDANEVTMFVNNVAIILSAIATLYGIARKMVK